MIRAHRRHWHEEFAAALIAAKERSSDFGICCSLLQITLADEFDHAVFVGAELLELLARDLIRAGGRNTPRPHCDHPLARFL
jgi:hypothetical protein